MSFINDAKSFSVNFKNDFIKGWKYYLVKFACLIIGLYFFTLAISVYKNTAVGVSQVDYSVFSIFLAMGKTEGGVVTAEGIAMYADILMWAYLIMSFVSFGFAMVAAIKQYKKTNSHYVWIMPIVILALDIAATFAIPQIITLQDSYINLLGINPDLKPHIRGWAFLLAYASYAVGIAFWVFSGWFSSPYNSICSNWIKMTGMGFSKSRVLMDLLIFLPGVIITLTCSASWDEKWNFFLTNINFGTVFFILLTGPIVGAIMGKGLVKYINLEKLKG